tara:strand:- start:553 stop:654 length:102 start_codon:yes stop_codon:yes gene_type:complete
MGYDEYLSRLDAEFVHACEVLTARDPSLFVAEV